MRESIFVLPVFVQMQQEVLLLMLLMVQTTKMIALQRLKHGRRWSGFVKQ